jgi:myo-inositol 2-dehydrogenase/D-chiro-inositol 1-dehydrogenase
MKRIAIAGAGNMARTRGRAFLDSGGAQICGVAARHEQTARVCATELNCDLYYDDYRRLGESRPDAILIETPHKVQDEIAVWALEAGFDLLIGGCLASSVEQGWRILERVRQGGQIVEAGYQRRYHPVWEEIRRLVRGGSLGEPIMAISMALWNADPEQWYYDQEASGGMPLTHMSYCEMNAIRWVLGVPQTITAMANRKAETGPGRVLEESCSASIGFASGAVAAATASYAAPAGISDADTRFVFTEGGLQIRGDSLIVFRGGGSEELSFKDKPSPFVRQAQAFLEALESRTMAQNPPADALLDLRIAAALSLSVRSGRTISLDEVSNDPL